MTKSTPPQKIFLILLTLLFLPMVIAPGTTDDWWDPNWYYRFELQINSTTYARYDWPIEHRVNFTNIFENLSVTEVFDERSIRVVEYNNSGGVIDEVRYQFDRIPTFDNSTNAAGDLVFLLNDSSSADEMRYYQVYFDTEARPKVNASYKTDLFFTWDGDTLELNNTVNTSGLRFHLDTQRGQNASGIYQLQDLSGNTIFPDLGASDNPIEYSKYSNTSHNFTFDFRGNLTVKHAGPIRMVFEQEGNETIFNDTSTVTEGFLKKTYTFYSNNQFIIVEQNFTNPTSNTITRTSTPSGALRINVFDADLMWVISGDTAEPGAYQWFASEFASAHVGAVHINTTSNYTVMEHNLTYGAMGVHLNQTDIPAGESIYDKTALHFNSPANIHGTPTNAQISTLSNQFQTPVIIVQNSGEKWGAEVETYSDQTIFNRGENITIFVNATSDNGSLVQQVNVSLISDVGDNITVTLANTGVDGDAVAGDSIFSGRYLFNNTTDLGNWTIQGRAFNLQGFFLNLSENTFNVTGTYHVETQNVNPGGLVSRLINTTVDVLNFRNDTWVTGASIFCTWNGTDINNFTDLNNGTYLAQFIAPSVFGTYSINCTANYTGNSGNDTDTFLTEDLSTNLEPNFSFDIQAFQSDQITIFNNQTFNATITVFNSQNASAYNPNVTFSAPSGWTLNTSFQSFGDVAINTSVSRGLSVTIPNGTLPTDYSINATIVWQNTGSADGSNNTSLTITVQPNPTPNITDESFRAVVAPGASTIVGNFSLHSIGNSNITDLVFTTQNVGSVSFTFVPTNITNLGVDQTQSVEINATVPANHLSGIYSGVINATDSNGSWSTTNITIEIPGTNLTIETNQTSVNSTVMRWYQFETTTLTINTTNGGTPGATSVNISLALPSNWTSNESSNTISCPELNASDVCVGQFIISMRQSEPGNETITAYVNWTDPGVGQFSNETTINVEVASFPESNIEESELNGSNQVGENKFFSNFTFVASGNDNLSSINFSFNGLDNFSFSFQPLISTALRGSNQTIQLNATPADGLPPDSYNGTMIVSSNSASNFTIPLNITVPVNRTWTLDPTSCVSATLTDEGEVCEVEINNSGNVQINITVKPSGLTNFTYANETFVTLNQLGSHRIGIHFNLTGQARTFYNATFFFYPNASADPMNGSVNISLLPNASAIVNVTENQTLVEEYSQVKIFANATDVSNGGIQFAEFEVVEPDGTTSIINMTLLSVGGAQHNYQAEFPLNYASSAQVGRYNYTVYATDAADQVGQSQGWFYVYPHINSSAETGSSHYYPGETASISYNATDGEGTALVLNTTITVYDTNDDGRYQGTHETNAQGKITVLPSFVVPSDVPLGNYTINTTESYYDADQHANLTVNGSSNYSFIVIEPYDVELETQVVWYPSSTMQFYVLLYTQDPIETPDLIDLAVYDPAQNNYFTATTGDFSIVNQTSNTLLYLYQFAMPDTTASGSYLADLTIQKGSKTTKEIQSFRVSTGGPYDVVIQDITAEAQQQRTQDFELLLINFGDVSQDVFLDYKITDGTIDYASVEGEAVFVAAGGNTTIQRSLDIYSDQPIGEYLLDVVMSYSTIQPDIQVNRSFRVVPYVPDTTAAAPDSSGGGGGGGGGGGQIIQEEEEGPSDIQILNVFPNELLIERGGIGYVIVEVKNTGFQNFGKIGSFFEGVPVYWFDLIREIPELEPGEVGYLITKFEIPANAEPGRMPLKLNVLADNLKTVEDFNLEVFESKEELLRVRIQKMSELIAQFEHETEVKAQEGFDVKEILLLLERSNEVLRLGQTYLDLGQLVESTSSLDEVRNTLEEVEYRLSIMTFQKPQLVEVIPIWIYFVIVGAFLLAGLGVFFLRGKIKAFRLAFSRRMFVQDKKDKPKASDDRPERKSIEKAEKKEEELLESELSETLRRHFDEGLISEDVFDELHKKYS